MSNWTATPLAARHPALPALYPQGRCQPSSELVRRSAAVAVLLSEYSSHRKRPTPYYVLTGNICKTHFPSAVAHARSAFYPPYTPDHHHGRFKVTPVVSSFSADGAFTSTSHERLTACCCYTCWQLTQRLRQLRVSLQFCSYVVLYS